MRACRSCGSELLASEGDESSPACVGEIAEVADANEASGQHMLAEAAQELRQLFACLALGIMNRESVWCAG